MKLSPNTLHTLGGKGAARVVLDDAVPQALATLEAGDWVWFDDDLGMGFGGYDNTPTPGLYSYSLSSQQRQFLGAQHVLDFIACCANNGLFASFHTSGSYDSRGNHWPDLCVVDASPERDLVFTDRVSRTGIVVRTADGQEKSYAQGQVVMGGGGSVPIVRMRGGVVLYGTMDAGRPNVLKAIGAQDPVSPKTGAFAMWCQRRGGDRWIVSYTQIASGLVMFPWVTSGPLTGWLLSTEKGNYDPDCGVRADGVVVVATGQNQGGTIRHMYEVDVDARRFRVDGGPWKPVVEVDLLNEALPPTPEIPRFPKACLYGAFKAVNDRPDYGITDGPWNALVLECDWSLVPTPKYVLTGRLHAPSVPPEWLRGIYTSAEGGLQDPDVRAAFEASLPLDKQMAVARKVPLVVNLDGLSWADARWFFDAYCQPMDGLEYSPGMELYPYKKDGVVPDNDTLAATWRRSSDAMLAMFWERFGHARCSYAHSVYTQWRTGPGTENFPLADIVRIQDPQQLVVREVMEGRQVRLADGRVATGEVLSVDPFAIGRPSGVNSYPEVLGPVVQEWADATASTTDPPRPLPPVLVLPPGPKPPDPKPPDPKPPDPKPPDPKPPNGDDMKLPDVVSLKDPVTDRFVGREPNTGEVYNNRTAVGGWEKWKPVKQGDGECAFLHMDTKTLHGQDQYLSRDSGGTFTTKPTVGSDEAAIVGMSSVATFRNTWQGNLQFWSYQICDESGVPLPLR